MLNLFKIDRPTQLEKRATVDIQLTTPPEDWEQEIMGYAYKLHPWLVEYTLAVDFLKKMPDRQFGIGGVLVFMKRPLVPARPSTNTAAMPTDAPIAQLPVIIREGQMSALDLVIINETILPMEEMIFRGALENTSLDGMTTSRRSDPTLIGHLWPPGRSMYGGPGAEMGLSVLNKFSSVDSDPTGFYFDRELAARGQDELQAMEAGKGYPLMSALLSGKALPDHQKIASLGDVVAGSPFLRKTYHDIITKVMGGLPTARPPMGSVIQVVSTPGGTMSRTTDPQAFRFSEFVPVSIDDALSDDPTCFCTLPPTAKLRTGDNTYVGFDSPVACMVGLHDGQQVRKGILFPTVVDIDGKPTGDSLFTDGARKNWCMADDLRIDVIAEAPAVSGGPVGGTGVWVYENDKGTVCTVPMTVVGVEQAKQGVCYRCTLSASPALSGAFMPVDITIKVFVAQGIIRPTYSHRNGTLLVPAAYKWVRIGASKFKPAMAFQMQPNVVRLRKLAANAYGVTGEPVAAVGRPQLSAEDTALLLAAAGVPVQDIPALMKSAELQEVELYGCRVLRPPQPLNVVLPDVADAELLKAAAVIDDPNTVDAVLGLNMMDYISDDNFMALVQYLQQAQQKIARLLLLSRLGLTEIPEGATKVVMSRLTPIINSMRALAFQRQYV